MKMETKIETSRIETKGEEISTPSSRSSTSSPGSTPSSMVKTKDKTPTSIAEIEKALKKNRDKKNVCILCGRYSVYVRNIYTADKKYYSYQYICPIIEKKSCIGKELKFTDSIPIIDDTTHSDIVYTVDENYMRQKATDLEITPKYGEIFTETELKSYGYTDVASIKKATAREKALEELSVEVSKKAEEAIARGKALEKALKRAQKVKKEQEEKLNVEVTRKVEEAKKREEDRISIKSKEQQKAKNFKTPSKKLNFDDNDLNSYRQKSIKKHENFFKTYDKNGNFSKKIQNSPNEETVDEYDKIIEELEKIIENPLSPVDDLFELMDIAINSSNSEDFLKNPAIKKLKTTTKTDTKTTYREYRETGNAKESYTKLQMI